MFLGSKRHQIEAWFGIKQIAGSIAGSAAPSQIAGDNERPPRVPNGQCHAASVGIGAARQNMAWQARSRATAALMSWIHVGISCLTGLQLLLCCTTATFLIRAESACQVLPLLLCQTKVLPCIGPAQLFPELAAAMITRLDYLLPRLIYLSIATRYTY